MKRVLTTAAIAGALLGLACGKSTTATPSPTVTSLTISPATDLLRIKATEKYSASAAFASGSAETVTAAWTSDNQAVATVDSSGTASGVGSGNATLTASYQGKTATRALRVVPDYVGHWAGTWTVTACKVQGDFQANWCAGVQGSFPAALDLLQTRDYASGTWTLQDSNGNVQGTIAGNGDLALAGTSLQSGVSIEVSAWTSRTTDNKTMAGQFTLTWRVAGKSGTGTTDVTLQNFTKQ